LGLRHCRKGKEQQQGEERKSLLHKILGISWFIFLLSFSPMPPVRAAYGSRSREPAEGNDAPTLFFGLCNLLKIKGRFGTFLR
jgi:hypothetical protein